jgi:3-deoxy-D-manno-octulosonate 8-phosphate phosphatase (KDO 8-P phosphatase)
MPASLLPDTEIAAPITCILSDVDGVMTDGRITYDNNGLETKGFHARDGLGIKLWMNSGFEFGILTSRRSQIVAQRGAELGIEHVQQGSEQKLPAAESMIADLGCSASQVCYVGDDIPDIPVMKHVALAVAPADAASDARAAAHWILRSAGGQGAIRELIERLLRAKQRWEEHLRQ